MSDIAEANLTEASRQIAAGAIGAVELTEAVLARVDALAPRLNCFVEIDAEGALDAARRADAERTPSASDRPLRGVPMAHKDLFYREGKVCACGSKIRSGFRPTSTARALSALEAAGSVYVGRLHMVEFAFGPTSHNQHLGPCRNPWNPDHIAGGSSSGSAAAVAARLVYGALGTDTGGSIRLPAAMCGLSGLKPTYGRVSRSGVMPLSHSLDHVGPLARSVEDCALILSIVAGHDPSDPTSSHRAVPDYMARLNAKLEGLKIGVARNLLAEGLDDDADRALAESLRVYEDLGARIVPVDVPDFELLRDLCRVVLTTEALSLHEHDLSQRPLDFSSSVRNRLETGLFIPASRYVTALRMREAALQDFLRHVLGEADVLHTPVLGGAAPRIDESDPDEDAQLKIIGKLPQRTQPFNYLGLPALVVPAGLSKSELPIGFQLIGRPFDEATLLNAGHMFQMATDWHRRCPPALAA